MPAGRLSLFHFTQAEILSGPHTRHLILMITIETIIVVPFYRSENQDFGDGMDWQYPPAKEYQVV